MMKNTIVKLMLGAALCLSVVVCGCSSLAEKHLTYDEEIQMKQLREEGPRKDPQQQRAYECAEWRRRHQGAFLDEPPECSGPAYERNYDPSEKRKKDVDDAIDRQLTNPSVK